MPLAPTIPDWRYNVYENPDKLVPSSDQCNLAAGAGLLPVGWPRPTERGAVGESRPRHGRAHLPVGGYDRLQSGELWRLQNQGHHSD